jgi:hypothetical protein
MGIIETDARLLALTEFVTEALVTDDDPPRKASAVSLMYHAGGAPQEIRSIRFGSRKWDAKTVATTIYRHAKNHAGGIRGTVQQYEVLVAYDDNPEPERRFPMVLDGDMGLAKGSIGTEGPTLTGQTQMLQRHTEASMRLVSQMAQETVFACSTLMNSTNDTLKQLREHNATLMKENHDAIMLAKDVILKEAVNTQARELELRKFDRASVEREQILKMLPALVNQITGQEIFPQSVEDTNIIETLEAKLTGEQIKKVADIIGGEAMAVIAPRLLKAADKREAAEKKKLTEKAGPNANGTGRAS